MTFNYLQKKFNHLVTDEYDSAIWSGKLLENYYEKIDNKYIYTRKEKTTYCDSDLYDVFILKIPKKAKKLTINSNNQYYISGDYNSGVGYINGNTIKSACSIKVTIDINNQYRFIGISVRANANTLIPNTTFIFE